MVRYGRRFRRAHEEEPMETPTNDPFKNLKEHPSTYIVQDRSSEEELKRLEVQDHLFTKLMGGVLPEQPDPTRFESVLDVACGPGGWLIETAQAYPGITRLVGIDISAKMIEYAQTRAQTAGVSDRVSFQTGDALRILDFPSESFDLVNLRFGTSWVKKWDWPRLIREFQRVAKPGGIIRITESSPWQCNLPAATRFAKLGKQAFYHAGHFFTPDQGGLIDHLADQMSKYGVMNVKTRTYTIEFHKDPQALQAFVEDLQRLGRTLAPFIKKWVKFSDDYNALYMQMEQEIHLPDFEASTTLLTAWGEAFKSS